MNDYSKLTREQLIEKLRLLEGRCTGDAVVAPDDRKRVEAELKAQLKAQRNLLQFVTQSIPDAVYFLDRGHCLRFANEAVLRLVREIRQRPELVLADLLDREVEEVFGSGELAAVFRAADEQAMSSGKTISAEDSVEVRGKMRRRHILRVPVRDDAGTVIGLVGIAHDITDRWQAEESLRASEAHLTSVLRAAPVGIGVLQQRVFQEVNATMTTLTGYRREELLGQSARMLYVSDADYEYVGTEKYRRIREQGVGSVETRWRCKDGKIIDVFLSSTPITGDDLTGRIVFAAEDITERRQAELSLQESEDRYRSLVTTSLDAVLMTAPDGRVLLANEAAGRMFGCSVEEVCRRGRNGVVDMTDARLPLLIAERARTGQVHGELTFVRTDGTKFPGEVSSVLFHDRNGEVRSSMVIRDVSVRKQAEAERLTAMARQRDTLVREVHHRIKNHLQGVSGMLRGMVSDYPESTIPLGKAIEKVRAIAQVYGLQSFRADASVRLCDLLRTAAENTLGPVQVACQLPPTGTEAILAPEEAVPMALVINELITNAMKHIDQAVPQRVIASLDITANRANLQIRNGPARLPPKFDFSNLHGIGTGLELVVALLPQQGASLDIRQEGDEVVAELRLTVPVVLPVV